MNGPRRAPSNRTTSFAGFSPQPAIAVGRASSQRPAAPTKLHVDELLGHDAPQVGAGIKCSGLGQEVLGSSLILVGLGHVPNHPLPILFHSRPPLQAPRLDGRNMPAATFRLTLQTGPILQ